ncbi:hypothetical protein D3C72_2461090 [compost metagenome]
MVYGVSANRELWWDNRFAAHLGFNPQDSSERFREKLAQQPKPAADDASAHLQGGAFTAAGPFGD